MLRTCLHLFAVNMLLRKRWPPYRFIAWWAPGITHRYQTCFACLTLHTWRRMRSQKVVCANNSWDNLFTVNYVSHVSHMLSAHGGWGVGTNLFCRTHSAAHIHLTCARLYVHVPHHYVSSFLLDPLLLVVLLCFMIDHQGGSNLPTSARNMRYVICMYISVASYT